MHRPSAGWISRRPGGGWRPGSAWIVWGSCPHETAHQMWLPFFDAGVSQGLHDGKGEGDPELHPAQAADVVGGGVVVFETEVPVEAGIDPRQGRASAKSALPGDDEVGHCGVVRALNCGAADYPVTSCLTLKRVPVSVTVSACAVLAAFSAMASCRLFLPMSVSTQCRYLPSTMSLTTITAGALLALFDGRRLGVGCGDARSRSCSLSPLGGCWNGNAFSRRLRRGAGRIRTPA